jgi:hypothetical protein
MADNERSPIDVLMILLIAGLGLAWLVSYVGNRGGSRELAKRAMCGAQLNGIGKGLALYKTEYRDSYLWAVDPKDYTFTNNAPMRLGGYDGIYPPPKDAASNPASPVSPGLLMSVDGKDNLHILENLCILVEKGSVNWNAFRCPSVSGGTMERNKFGPEGTPNPATLGNRKYGFFGKASADDPGTYFIDYAMHWGYDNKDVAASAGRNKAPLDDQTPGEVVILADQHGASLKEFKRNDPQSDNDGRGFNHGDEGLNMLYANGGVTWVDKVNCGWGGNNIYTRDLKVEGNMPLFDPHKSVLDPSGTAQEVPRSKYDSVLVNAKP